MNCKWRHAALCPSFLSQEIKTLMGERIQQRSYSLLKLGQHSPVQHIGKLDFHLPEFLYGSSAAVGLRVQVGCVECEAV